jgi:hypothetical protein
MLNFMALDWPQVWKKGYHQIWEANLQPLGPNVSAFINILTSIFLAFISSLGSNNKPKMLNVGPQFFSGPNY